MEALTMNYRVLKRFLPLVLIAGITLTSIIMMTTELSSATAQPTNSTSVKESVKKKVVIDSAVAKATITQLLSKAGKAPKQPIVNRTTVEGNYAIATWIWGEAGGQSILTKKQGRWQVLSGGGGAINLTTLKEVGVPDKTARSLMQKETAAQKK
jgi:hypothetical protein